MTTIATLTKHLQVTLDTELSIFRALSYNPDNYTDNDVEALEEITTPALAALYEGTPGLKEITHIFTHGGSYEGLLEAARTLDDTKAPKLLDAAIGHYTTITPTSEGFETVIDYGVEEAPITRITTTKNPLTNIDAALMVAGHLDPK